MTSSVFWRLTVDSLGKGPTLRRENRANQARWGDVQAGLASKKKQGRTPIFIAGRWPILLFSMLFAHIAVAAPKVDALGKFTEGVREFGERNYEKALRAFQISMELEPSPNTRFKIAKTYLALDRLGSAYRNFRRAAEEALDRTNVSGDARYHATREAALAQVAELEREVPRLTIVASDEPPPNLTVTIDEEVVPPTMFATAIEVDPGEHVIVATGPRMQRFERRIRIARAESQNVELLLAHMPTATVDLKFLNRPAGVAVSLDDHALAPELFEQPLYLNPGDHQLTASAPGYAQFTWRRRLQDDEKVQIPIQLKLPPDRRKWAVVALASAAVVALSVGIGVGVIAEQNDQAQQEISPLLRDPIERDRIRRQALIADSAFAVGGALAGTALVLGILTRWRDTPGGQRRTAWLAPWIHATGAGFATRLRF